VIIICMLVSTVWMAIFLPEHNDMPYAVVHITLLNKQTEFDTSTFLRASDS